MLKLEKHSTVYYEVWCNKVEKGPDVLGKKPEAHGKLIHLNQHLKSNNRPISTSSHGHTGKFLN